MKPVTLKEGVFWVGAIDWAIRDFHGYEIPKGTTYNNYLVMDVEPALVDGVKLEFAGSTIENIKSLIEPGRIKHLIVNHIEPDHGGALSRLIPLLAPGVLVHCTEKGRKGLSLFHDTSGWNFHVVKTGDTLNIGKQTLVFIETPMLHWPDSMMTYMPGQKLLFSQDAFGQHIASAQRFDDDFVSSCSVFELEDSVWDYYANILMPFGGLIKTKLEEMEKLGIAPDMIAPAHGVVWRKEPSKPVSMYRGMIEGRAEERVTIIYDSMWGGTGRLAQPIMEGVKDAGLDCRVFKLRATPLSVCVKEFWRARGCLLGSPTLNGLLLPSMGQLLTYLKGLKPKNRMAGAFGTFGWAALAVNQIMEEMRGMGLEVFSEPLKVNYSPSRAATDEAYDWGGRFARALREYHQRFPG
jgi:flavorubredoxin